STNPMSSSPSTPPTGSVTRGTLEPACSPRSKSPRSVTCLTGRRNSTHRSTEFAPLSSESSPTSRPGESSTQNTDARWQALLKPSQPSSLCTSINWPLNNPLWFIGVYLFVVLFAPLMEACHRRSRWLTLAGLVVASVVFDVFNLRYEQVWAGAVNL